MPGLLDPRYWADGAASQLAGLNRGLLNTADTLIGNPLAGLLNTATDSNIQSGPMLRMAQEYGIAQGTGGAGEMLGNTLSGMIPIAGDIAGAKGDFDSYMAGKMPWWAVPLAFAGLLPFVPPAARYIKDKLPHGIPPSPGGMAGGRQRGALMYHGTPHTWAPEPRFPEGRPRYDSDVSFTGEGANAYGAGFYAAESPDVAAQYRQAGKFITAADGSLPTHVTFDGKDIGDMRSADVDKFAVGAYDNLRHMVGDDPDAVADLLERSGEPLNREAGQWLRANKSGLEVKDSTNLYQFDFPDEHMPNLLDLDKPMSEQSESVKRALQDAKIYDFNGANAQRAARSRDVYDPGFQEDTGTTVYDYLGSPNEASKALLEAGIPGARFLDGTSRSAGAGTSNYVLFNPQDYAKDVKRIK